MLIPVFTSCPTDLSVAQFDIKRAIEGELGRQGLESRAVGQTDYPTSNPLTEVLMLGHHCAGGVILGFTQFSAPSGCFKPGTGHEKKVATEVVMPTPWNQIEAGLLFALGKPLIVFRENGISGGVFEAGNTNLFIHEMPLASARAADKKRLREVLQRFSAQVRSHYYQL